MAYQKDAFEEYKRQGEPEKAEKSLLWQTAIGLQQVDGLTPSPYLVETAKQNIEGKISFREVHQQLDGYYKAKPVKSDDNRTEEADKVSARITEILSERAFSFSPAEFITIHRRLFDGIYPFAGRVRDYNIEKHEWVLNGDTVQYASAESIRATLDYDFKQEKTFAFQGLTKEEIVEHITAFTSSLWQIHAFGEGNTRTTAVFIIKYLRSLGFNVTNDLFADHSWYFRNALVRANYTDYVQNIYSTTEYLSRFFGNLLLGENNPLKSRDLRIPTMTTVFIAEKVPETAPDVPDVPDEPDAAGILDAADDTGIPDTPEDRRDEILNKLHSNPYLTARELAEAFSVADKTIKRDFAALKQEGKLKRIGSDRGGHWEVTP